MVRLWGGMSARSGKEVGSIFSRMRRDFDVTDSVNVSSASAVYDATRTLFVDLWPNATLDELWLAFHDFQRLYEGRMPDYRGCDTVYHDIQHTLDMTLAMARLIAGHERTVATDDRLGQDRALLGIICALFHDAGYIREINDQQHRNGAEFTACHVSRSAAFLRNYLPRIGLGRVAGIAAEIVHFTGYERPLDAIEIDDPLYSITGHLLGTADLIAQMADRCYLEKCRDRLYLEFVLGGVAIEESDDGMRRVRYQSGIDLLLQTPEFYRSVVRKRLDKDFNSAYRYIEALYAGQNPYMNVVERNIVYLEHIIATGAWPALRRSPPCYTATHNPLTAANALVNQRMVAMRGQSAVLATA